MKKFTLLAAAALMAGSAFAQAPEEINGLKLSSGKDTTQFHFYRITNMRAQRLDYTNGTLRNQAGDSINRDGGGYYMSETLEDGTPTPQISDSPYMGLSNLDANWWLSFANDPEIKDPNTEFWYFTWGGKQAPKTVYIKNAVINGSVSDEAHFAKDLAGYSRKNMDFNTKSGNRYYVLPVRPAFEAVSTDDENWVDSILKNISEEQFNQAFALCLNDTLVHDGGDCLDMNNYINVASWPIMKAENGEDSVDADGNKVHYRYGFAGVDRTWSPIRKTANKNHWENNGSMFFVEEATAEEAMEAIEAYKKVIAEGFQKGAVQSGKAQFANATNLIKGWLNVPAIWGDEVKGQLQSIMDYCETWEGDGVDASKVSDPDTRDAFIAEVKKIADGKLAEAAKLVGTGCIVRFKNQTAIRDLSTFLSGAGDPDLMMDHAYLAAGGNITYRVNGAIEEVSDLDDLVGFGVVPSLDATPETEWELQYVPGTYSFRLYNASTKSWIRKRHDMYQYLQGEDYLPDNYSEISWATTPNVEDAAPFFFTACPDPEGQDVPTDEELENIGYAGLDQEITNKVRLTSSYTNTVVSNDGKPTTTSYTYNIHRGSSASNYKFIDWTYTRNNWYADSNAFLVEGKQRGSINEVGVDNNVKATGIYDLQGRRVNKATKGVYIINGVKTFVR
jgi:hypothetical protein